MRNVDVHALVRCVTAILAAPQDGVPTTGDTLLDASLASLAQQRRRPDRQPVQRHKIGIDWCGATFACDVRQC